MDSEKHNEIQDLVKKGRPAGDEGPFYHHTFWESYKGSVKGKFGGLVIGLLVGAVVGAATALLLPYIGVTGVTAATAIGGMSVMGMAYGMKEFGEVGRVTGAVAAAGKDSEKRMQTFEKGKFEEIKQDINELKSMVSGKPIEEVAKASKVSHTSTSEEIDNFEEAERKLASYRTSHHDASIPKPAGNGLIFWKVAAVGLAVGSGLGLLLSAVASTGVIAAAGTGVLGELLASPAASALTVGLIGASFGINRDSFRKIFDKTDSLFRGMFDFTQPTQRAPEQAITINASVERPKVKTLVYPDAGIDYPTSETHHQDKVMQNARQLLAAMDHTTASRH